MRNDRSPGRPLYDLIQASPLTTVASLCMTLSALEREWSSLVGDRLAFRTAPKALEGDVLVVTADGQAVLQDLNFKKSALVRKIRAGTRIELRDVRVELGSVLRKTSDNSPRRSRQTPPPRAARVDPDAVELMAAKILASYGAMAPELARTIARCRIMAGE